MSILTEIYINRFTDCKNIWSMSMFCIVTTKYTFKSLYQENYKSLSIDFVKSYTVLCPYPMKSALAYHVTKVQHGGPDECIH